MQKHKSIFFSLLAPIATITALLLLIASLTLSAVYMRQAVANAVASNTEILNQTRASLEILHSYFAQLTADISQKPYLSAILKAKPSGSIDEWNARYNMGLLFSKSPKTMIDYELIVAGENGLIIGSGYGGIMQSAEDIMASEAFRQSLATGRMIYRPISSGISYSSKNHRVIIGYKALCHSGGAPYGCLMLSIREEDLRKFYQNFISRDSSISLLSSDGIILSSQPSGAVGTKDARLLASAKYNEEHGLGYSRGPGQGLVLSQYIPYMDAYIISEISTARLLESFLPNLQALLVIAGTLALLILMTACIIRRNLKPLRVLAGHMASSRGVPTPIELGASAEMQMISDSYNEMVESVNHYLKELDAAHSKRRRDELNLLQMQINPHFLYNTLDSVKHLIAMSDTVSACSTIDALIALLRSSLGKTDTIVRVEEEINNIQNYISIIEPRYGGLIQTRLHVDEECRSLAIPNLILQPIVENAFFHAFQNTKQGSIHIFITRQEDALSCEVIDNGDGMEEEHLRLLLRGGRPDGSASRIGVANVRDRLRLLYPGKSSFHISSEPGYGTSVHFTIPAMWAGENGDGKCVS